MKKLSLVLLAALAFVLPSIAMSDGFEPRQAVYVVRDMRSGAAWRETWHGGPGQNGAYEIRAEGPYPARIEAYGSLYTDVYSVGQDVRERSEYERQPSTLKPGDETSGRVQLRDAQGIVRREWPLTVQTKQEGALLQVMYVAYLDNGVSVETRDFEKGNYYFPVRKTRILYDKDRHGILKYLTYTRLD